MIGGGGVRFSETAELFLSVWVSRLAVRPALLHTHWVQTKSAEGTIRVVPQPFPVRFRSEVLDST